MVPFGGREADRFSVPHRGHGVIIVGLAVQRWNSLWFLIPIQRRSDPPKTDRLERPGCRVRVCTPLKTNTLHGSRRTSDLTLRHEARERRIISKCETFR